MIVIGLHIDIPSRAQIERLLRASGDNLVSIYLPTSPITPEADAARIAFKNLAAGAVAELHAARAEAADREAIEEGLGDLNENHDFWAEQAHSLAVFADPHGLRSFRLPKVNSYPHLVARSLPGSPEASSDAELSEAVRAADVPGGGPAAAILRYPV